jgi:serine/threonine protein kinase
MEPTNKDKKSPLLNQFSNTSIFNDENERLKISDEQDNFSDHVDYDLAINLLGAEVGEIESQCILAEAYRIGRGVKQDDVQAFYWYKKAADQGNLIAQYRVAEAYRLGHGVDKDEAQASSWYKEAAEKGVADAQFRLGKFYRYGTGVIRDIDLAIDYFTLAAEQGHQSAQNALEKTKTYKGQQRTIQKNNTSTLRNNPFIMIDSSVILKDPDVIRRVIQNKGIPFITDVILSELDYNKTNIDPDVASNARCLLRELAKENSFNLFVLPEDVGVINGDLAKQFNYRDNTIIIITRPIFKTQCNNDAKIIYVAKDYGMIIITADSGMKVRAESFGVDAYLWGGQVNNKKIDKKNDDSGFQIVKEPTSELPIVLNVTHLPQEGDILHSAIKGPINLVKILSAGGEGTIFESNFNDLVCKIYHKNQLTNLKQKKIELMLSRKVVKEGVCWPIDILKNNSGEFVGYLMPKAKGRPMQHVMFRKPALEKTFPNWSRIDLVNVCLAFLDKLLFLHSFNIIVGDINPLNILVSEESNNVWLVDTDSFQIQGFPCPVGTVNFTAPEIQGVNYSSFLRTKEHEIFAVATMLFMILHPGKPPYAQQGGGDPAENIRNGNFPYQFGKDVVGNAPEGPWRIIWANLPGKIKEAFWNTFKNNKRIELNDWKQLLRLYRSEILKGYHSNELFPTSFKIKDPVKIICGQCSEEVIASEKRVQRMISEGKSFYCGKCMANIRLKILAKKARDASQGERESRSNTDFSSFFSPSYNKVQKPISSSTLKKQQSPNFSVLSQSQKTPSYSSNTKAQNSPKQNSNSQDNSIGKTIAGGVIIGLLSLLFK